MQKPPYFRGFSDAFAKNEKNGRKVIANLALHVIIEAKEEQRRKSDYEDSEHYECRKIFPGS